MRFIELLNEDKTLLYINVSHIVAINDGDCDGLTDITTADEIFSVIGTPDEIMLKIRG
jgi:hypothetical protein